MFQGTPSLAAMSGKPADLCGRVGSPAVIRERPAEAFRPKQITIWVCEAKALYWLAYDKKDSYTIATQLSLSQILLGAISKQSGAPRN